MSQQSCRLKISDKGISNVVSLERYQKTGSRRSPNIHIVDVHRPRKSHVCLELYCTLPVAYRNGSTFAKTPAWSWERGWLLHITWKPISLTYVRPSVLSVCRNDHLLLPSVLRTLRLGFVCLACICSLTLQECCVALPKQKWSQHLPN